MDVIGAILVSVVVAATPLLLAAAGELIVEKAGVLNLGVEGMMLAGAIAGFAVVSLGGGHALGLLAAAGAGMTLATLFGVLTLVLLTQQVPTGLALTIFGVGLSALVGQSFVGSTVERLPRLDLLGLGDLPLIGPVLFDQDAVVYLSILATLGLVPFLRSRAGLVLRAVGEDPDAAHRLGYDVIGVRFLAVVFGGAMAGLGGAYLSLAYTPLWAENMTAGRGWIALALVVFATWRPARLILGAYLFGGITLAQLHAQGLGVNVASQFLSMLPYLATIFVLVLISRDALRIRLNAPAALGQSFRPER